MARRTGYDSASCHFFIMHKDYSGLDGQYAAFGYVVSGMEIVNAICEGAEPINGDGSIAKDQQPVILSVTIRKEK